ncbi:hypothetical protein ACE01N_15645 [Saccharicrinis sp. FJH2]|uniref:hypothetical protein n=1 Tax=Saccharicrinis sp. FJH65 TaxID=3344659 RepID=UPI0035F35E82
MANKNHKIRLLCDTNQMAYGSSSALLAILKYLSSSNTAFVWGVTEKILKSSDLIESTIKINNKDAESIKKSVDFRKYDAILVISNSTNLNTYLDLEIPVFYVDIHYWYPSNKNHRVWKEAEACFIEKYFVESITLPKGSIEVGPIISLPQKKVFIKKQVLINIGGGANQYIKPGINSRYINVVIELLDELRKESLFKDYTYIIAGGQASINSIKTHKYSKSFMLKTFSKEEFLDTLLKSEIFFTSPGQYATFEGLYLEKKVIFLPPQNASQIIQTTILENAGLINKGLNLPDYYPEFSSLNHETIIESELTTEVLIAINKLANDTVTKSKIVTHLKDQLNDSLKPDYFVKQKKYLEILGAPGAESVANNILDFFKQKGFDNAVKSNSQHDKLCNDEVLSGDEFITGFPNILHDAETLLFERIWSGSQNIQEIQNRINLICQKYETLYPARNLSFRLACTTTDSDGAIKTMVDSLVEELSVSGWNTKKEGILFDILIIENSKDVDIVQNNHDFCANFKHEKVNIKYIPWIEKNRFNKRPYSIAESRIYLIEWLKKLDWHASSNKPVWVLDDDFEFKMTIPDKRDFAKELRVGSVFHRMECLINEGKSDAIVGGNSGSCPIPELSTIRLQLMDLREFLKNGLVNNRGKVLNQIKLAPNYYYDLSREKIDYFPVIPEVWISNSSDQDEFLNSFFYKLLNGTPASRPLFANFQKRDGFISAWDVNDESIVSGGNTLYMNDELLSTDEYYALNYFGLISRRSDAIWFLRNHQKGYKIKKKNLAITHNRKSRCDNISKESLQRKALSDVIGVGFWESINESDSELVMDIDMAVVRRKIVERLRKYNKNIELARLVLYDIEKICPNVNHSPYFGLLKDVLSEPLAKIDYNALKLVNYGNTI